MPTKQGSGSKPPPKEKASKKAKSLVCKVCEDEVTDQSKTKDSIFCEGMCDGWIHRYCAGLSTTAFLHFQASSEPFICPHCKLLTQAKANKNDASDKCLTIGNCRTETQQLLGPCHCATNSGLAQKTANLTLWSTV